MPGWLIWPLVALSIYSAAYFSMLQGRLYRPIGTNPVTGVNKFVIEPRYYGEGYVPTFFAPIHAIDRQYVRPDYWAG
jgi:hypothetical protein